MAQRQWIQIIDKINLLKAFTLPPYIFFTMAWIRDISLYIHIPSALYINTGSPSLCPTTSINEWSPVMTILSRSPSGEYSNWYFPECSTPVITASATALVKNQPIRDKWTKQLTNQCWMNQPISVKWIDQSVTNEATTWEWMN